jgi:hypothetical protein
MSHLHARIRGTRAGDARLPLQWNVFEKRLHPSSVVLAAQRHSLLAEPLVVLAQLEEPANAIQLCVRTADRVLVEGLGPTRTRGGLPQLVADCLMEIVSGQAPPQGVSLLLSATQGIATCVRTGAVSGWPAPSRRLVLTVSST